MAETPVAPKAPKKRRSLLRTLIWLVAVVVVLGVVAYFVGTSAGFLKGFILPRVSKAMNATITVSDATVRPFSEVVLRDLKVQTTGPEPLVTAQEVRARYRLLDIVRGNLKVEEVLLASPTVHVVQNADGTSNLDPILKARAPKPDEKKPAPSQPAPPPQVDLKRVALNNATVRLVKHHPGGGQDVTELSNVTVTLDDLKNGQTGQLTLTAEARLDQQPPAPATNATLQAKATGSFNFTLGADLMPSALKGNTQVAIAKAGGLFAEMAGLSANLDCEVTPKEIRQAALRFLKGTVPLGEVRASGPLDLETREGQVFVQVLAIDRQVLNLAGARAGVDFGGTTINSTNTLRLTRAGSVLDAAGLLTCNKFSLTRSNQTTPTVDLAVGYGVTVDQSNKWALVKTLDLAGTQNERPLLRAGLTSPMRLAWGDSTETVPDAALNLSLTNLNLADWRAFTGDAVSEGTVNLTGVARSQKSGKELSFNLEPVLDGLAVKVGSNEVRQLRVALWARGTAKDLKQVTLADYGAKLAQQGQWLLESAGSGTYDLKTADMDLQFRMDLALPRAAQLAPMPDLAIAAGVAQAKARLVGNQQSQNLKGALSLTDLTGRYGQYQLNAFNLTSDLELGLKDQLVRLHKVSGALRQATNAAGAFDLTGEFDMGKQTGQLAMKLSDLNQHALRPFLAPALGERKLISVTLNTSVSTKFDPAADSAAKAEVQLANLVVSDPRKRLPETPLEARVQLDAGLKKQVLDLRQLQLNLTPTARAKNEILLSGKVDMTDTNAIQGALKLVAQTLDFTAYYDLFADQAKAAPPPTAPPPAAPETEPPPVKLPLRNFTAELAVGRMFLREVDVANLQATARLDGSRVTLKPMQCTLNGAPVNAGVDLDLGVPGYQYDLSFTADRIPVEPLANSFSPDYRGQAKGELHASAQIKGAGTTGASLQKTLTGQTSLLFTNADIQLVGRKAKLLLTPIALVLGLTELTKSPVQVINAQAQMGQGKIQVGACQVVGPAFQADTSGDITLASVLTNSTINNWPVRFSLSRNLAERARLLPANTPTNASYVALPQFAKVTGTLGQPSTHTDKLALAALLGSSVGGLPGVAGTKAGEIIQGVGGLLTSPLGGGASTNQANTNKPAILNPLDLLRRPKK
jgi:uncharacterized protein involved in outer membrane biogenesis